MGDAERARPGLDLNNLLQGIAALGLLLYVAGSIVVNSHLASFGIQSFDLIEARYITAGGLLVLTLCIYAGLVGRRVFYLDHDIKETAQLGVGSRFKVVWELFAGIHVIMETLFATVFSAWLIASILEEGRPSDLFLAVGGTFFMFDYVLLWTGFYRRNPTSGVRISFLLHFMVVFLFFLLSDAQLPRELFWVFVVLSVILNLLLDLRNRIAQSRFHRVFEVGWVLFTVLLFTVYFGSRVYGRVQTSLGGGKPQPVRLILRDAGETKLLGIPDKGEIFPERVLLVTENENEIVFTVARNTGNGIRSVRLNKDAVVAIISIE